MVFSERLKEIRLERGLNQKELAHRSELSPQSISSFECGINRPTVPSLLALAETLNVSIDYLLGRTDEAGELINYKSAPLYSSKEQLLIANFRKLPSQTQDYVFGIVQNLADNS